MEFIKFCMELTKFCVELVWMLCFCVELVWILNLGFIPTFGLILGLIVGWFYAMFLACFVSCLWHVLWSQLGGYCGWWTRAVSEWFRVKMACTRVSKELSGTLLRGSHAMAGLKIEALGYAIAWVSTQLRSPCTPSSLQLRTVITSSSELHFGCS